MIITLAPMAWKLNAIAAICCILAAIQAGFRVRFYFIQRRAHLLCNVRRYAEFWIIWSLSFFMWLGLQPPKLTKFARSLRIRE